MLRVKYGGGRQFSSSKSPNLVAANRWDAASSDLNFLSWIFSFPK
ncbi:hypothetical protein [Daejeonella sp.]|nr:hypothetical protein [Daejeonella sp.]